MAKLIKTKSRFTFKSAHQKTSDGTVFERDFMTTSGSKGFSKSEVPLYVDSNFLFVTRGGLNVQKKHKQGEWLMNDCADSPTVWRLGCLDTTGATVDSGITINPNYEALTDFAYYGSASDLIRSTINDVAMKFPAELYFSEKTKKISGETYYVVPNKYNIDIASDDVISIEVENTLRYMSLGYASYNFIDTSGNTTPLTKWIVTHDSQYCIPEAGGFTATAETDGATLYLFQTPSENYILYDDEDMKGCRLRPNDEAVEGFYENIHDLEAILLDRETTPLYTCVFNTPYQTEDGFFTEKRDYIWPSDYGWNPDISSNAFSNYVDDLIKLAEFHDEYDSNNIWRMMTHDAIKNLDSSRLITSTSDGDGLDDTRVEAILKLYGRQFDELKRYIDNFKTLNNITYDKKSNIPDQFLSESLQLQGWDVKALNPSFSDTENADVVYPGKTYNYTPAEANNEFMRRLKLNSNQLFNMKGTRKGIESILALMGFKKYKYVDVKKGETITGAINVSSIPENPDNSSAAYIKLVNPASGNNGKYYRLTGDYTMEEYVEIAKPKTGTTYPKAETAYELNNKFKADGEMDVYGLPTVVVSPAETGQDDYIIPWFDKDETYTGDIYFQMSGGWAKTDERDVWYWKKDTTSGTWKKVKGTILTDTTDPKYLSIYGETSTPMKFVATIGEMLALGAQTVGTNSICYVTDLSDFKTYFGEDLPNEEVISHYFALWNGDYWYTTVKDGDKGWVYIPQDYIIPQPVINDDPSINIVDFKKVSGRKVLYLESIVNTFDGNNPHVSNDKYDDGQEYIDALITPFKEKLARHPMAGTLEDDEKEVMKNFGWTGTTVIDNKKCWYFRDSDETSKWSIKGQTGDTGYTFGLDTYNPEPWRSTEKNDEAAANSVINVKNFKVHFWIADEQTTHSIRNYINDRVMFFAAQMIPSSTILRWEITDSNKYPGGEVLGDTGILIDNNNHIDGVIYATMGQERDTIDGQDFLEDSKIIKMR